MGIARITQTNFNRGEIDPKLTARVSLQSYGNSLKKARNIFVIDEGRVIEQGNDNELLMKDGRYKMLHDLNTF